MMKKLLLFTISVLVFSAINAQVSGDYRTATDGSWTTVSVWEVYDGSDWNPATTAPDGTNNVTINNSITFSGNLTTTGYFLINSAGTLTLSDGSLTVQSDFEHYGTLNIGDGVEDFFHVDGGIYFLGDGSSTDVSGYFKVDNSGEFYSTNTETADLTIGSAGDPADNVNNLFYMGSDGLYDLDGGDITIDIPNGNSGTADEILIESGAFSTEGSGSFILGDGGTKRAVTDWSVKIGSGQVISNLTVDVGSGGTVSLFQDDARSGTDYIEFNSLTLTSGTFQIEPLAGLFVSDNNGITGSGNLRIESDATGTGELVFEGSNITSNIERYIPGNEWHQICFTGDPGGLPPSNFISASVVDQDNNPDVWLMTWDNVNTNWDFVTDPSTNLPLWFGVAVYGAGNFTISYSESMTSATHTVSDPGAQLDKFQILTNPYPSSYDAMSGGSLGGLNIYNQIWTWDPSGAGQYATYTGGTGGTYSGIVAAGQSFFVKASATGTATYSISKAKRTFGAGNNFLKKGKIAGWEDDFGIGTYAMLKVTDGSTKDAGFVNFGEFGTNGYEDGYDGFKKFGDELAPQLYFVESDLELSINYLEPLDEAEERVVQMNFIPGIEGEHKLMCNLLSLPNTKVTLEDLKTGTFHIFNDSEQYSFIAALDDEHDRFLLHFLYSPTGIENPGEIINEVSIYSYNKTIYLAAENFGQADVRIFDLMGRQLFADEIVINGNTQIPVNVDNSYLIVKVINESTSTTKKVFVK